MRILLNATHNELQQLGGDFTLYQDWRRLCDDGLVFDLLAGDSLRQTSSFLRKGFEKMARAWEPTSLRRLFFLTSRFLYMPSRASENADLIFSHLLFPWLNGGSIPIVWSSQGISPALYYQRYNRGQWTVEDVAFVYSVLGKRADALVIATDLCARNVVHWCPELTSKVHVVPAPVFVDLQEIPEKPSSKDGRLRLLFVGVDSNRKGLPEVLEAFRRLQCKHPDLLLDVVSRPPDELRRKIEHLSGVTLYISSSAVDVHSLMRQSDVFVLPTRADTYALAAVEAMAHGCAVILSDLEPLPEVAPDNEVGFTVPVGDAGALVDKLEVLANDEASLRRFQAGAWQRYLSYHTPAVVAGRLRKVFVSVLAGRGGTSS